MNPLDPTVQAQLQGWVFLLATLAFCVAVLYMIAVALRRKQQNEMQRHMLDKFASAKDFADFVQSPTGQNYFMTFSEATTSPRNAILGSVRTGIVLIFGGAGLAVTKYLYVPDIGFFLISLGFGFLISAGISWFLAKRMAPEPKE